MDDRQLRSRRRIVVYWGAGNGFPWVGAGAAQATTSSPHPHSRSTSRPAPSKGTSSTRRMSRGTGTKCRRPFSSTIAAADARSRDSSTSPRNGYLYFLERKRRARSSSSNGHAVRERRTCSSASIPKTGRPDIDEARKPDIGKIADFCPSWHGAKNWQPGAYNPKTRMVYAPTQENICAVMIGRTIQTSTGATRAASTQRMFIAPGADHLERSSGMERGHREEGMDATTSRSRRTGGRS